MADRRSFCPRCYGRVHSGTECLAHVELTGFPVSYVFDFRYAMDFELSVRRWETTFPCDFIVSHLPQSREQQPDPSGVSGLRSLFDQRCSEGSHIR